METKDYFSIVALFFSLGSLAYSVHVSRFNSRVKCAEIRSQLQTRINSMLVDSENLETSYKNLKDDALNAKEIELFKSLNYEDKLKQIVESVHEFKSVVDSSKGSEIINIFENISGHISLLEIRIKDVFTHLDAAKDHLIKHLNKSETSE